MTASSKDNQIDYVEFPAASAEAFQAAKQFYADVFGWKFQDWGEDYADTKSSGIASGFNADPSHRSPAPLIVLYSSELEATRTKVNAAGGKITKEIFSFPGGRRFHYLDPAGNQLAVWSDK